MWKFSGYVPGAIGRITEIHALYYKKHWDFDLFFESKVATEMSEFLNRFDRAHDGFWVAMVDGKIAGSVAIDGKESGTQGARLRFFITDPGYQGRGVGRGCFGRRSILQKGKLQARLSLQLRRA